MKKCRNGEREEAFAARVVPGEFFAVSETTYVPSLRRALLERGIGIDRLHPINMTNEQFREYRRHWAVYEATELPAF